MAQFEEYLDHKKRETNEKPFEVYENEVNKNFKWDEKPNDYIPYTSDDMDGMFAERMDHTTYDDRTRYYFEDHNYMLAKAKRYLRLSEDRPALDEYASRYDYRDGKKRQKITRHAALYFARAWEKEKELARDIDQKAIRDNYQLYERRERIMDNRLDGMLSAAMAKARGKVHEKYLMNRAKLSCYMILKDQAENLRAKCKPNETALIRKFGSKIRSLEGKINSVKASIKSSIPSTKQQWHNRIDLNVGASRLKTRQQREEIELSTDSAKIGVCLSYCLESMGKRKYPCTVPLTDGMGAPVSLSELKKKEWNRAYEEAVESNDQDTKKRMDLEALKRFEDYKVPALINLINKGSVHFFMESPGVFMEMVYCAAPYYQSMMNSDEFIRSYAKNNPRFKKKVALLNELRRNFINELRAMHHQTIEEGEGDLAGAYVLNFVAPVDGRVNVQDFRRNFSPLYRAFTSTQKNLQENADAELRKLNNTLEKTDDKSANSGVKMEEINTTTSKNLIIDESDDNIILNKSKNNIILDESKDNLILNESKDNLILDGSEDNLIQKKKTKQNEIPTDLLSMETPRERLTAEEQEEEYGKLLEINEDLTMRGYMFYHYFRDNQDDLKAANELKEILVNQIKVGDVAGKPVFKDKSNASFNGAAGALLYSIPYREHGSVNTANGATSLQNREWICSWAAGKENEREKLIESTLPLMLQEVKLPTEKELKEGWIERQLDEQGRTFADWVRRMHCMRALMNEQSAMITFVKMRPYLDAKLNACIQLSEYVESYMQLKYGIVLFDEENGCMVRPPMEKNEKDSLQKDTDGKRDTYAFGYRNYENQEEERRNILKEKEIYQIMGDLEAYGERLKKKEEKESRKEGRRPDAGTFNEILQEIREEKKSGKKIGPMAPKEFPTAEQLKKGWVDQLLQKDPEGLIRFLLYGQDEKNLSQRDAYIALKAIITMTLTSKYGVTFGEDEVFSKSMNVDYDRNMKNYIDVILTREYLESYWIFMGMDPEKEKKKYPELFKQDGNLIIQEEQGETTAPENEVIGEKKDGKNKNAGKGAGKSKSQNLNSINIIKEEDPFDDEEKELQKDSNISSKDVRKHTSLNSAISNEQRKKLAEANKNFSKEERLKGGSVFVADALNKSNSYATHKDAEAAFREMSKRKVYKEEIDNTYMGAPSALIQSIDPTKDEQRKLAFNKAWCNALAEQKSENEEKRKQAKATVKQMIKDNLGNILNGFKLPSPEEIENGWFAEAMRSRPFELLEYLRKAQAAKRLANVNKDAQDYCYLHFAFRKMVDACALLYKYAVMYMKLYFRVEVDEKTGRANPTYLRKLPPKVFAVQENELKSFVYWHYRYAYQEVKQEDINAFANAKPAKLIAENLPEESKEEKDAEDIDTILKISSLIK